MKWITRLLVAIMAVGLATTAVVWVADATTWNQTYLQQEVTKTDLATKLAAALPDVASAYAPGGEVKTAVAATVTSAYVGEQLESLIPNFINAFRHGGPAPALNLTGLGSQLSASNLPLPPNFIDVLNTPRPLVPDNLADPLRSVGRLTGDLKDLAPLVALIAAILIVAVARHHRYSELALGLVGGAILTAIAALFAQLPPSLIGAGLDTSIGKPLVPAIRGFVQTISNDQTHRLLIIAACFVGAAVLLMVVHLVMDILWRLHQHHESKPKPEV